MNENKPFEHEIDPDLLAEIEEWEKADHDEPTEYYFSNPDPYLKPQPLPSDHPRHNCCFNVDGYLCVKNLSAFWVPELTVTEVIHGTVDFVNADNFSHIRVLSHNSISFLRLRSCVCCRSCSCCTS